MSLKKKLKIFVNLIVSLKNCSLGIVGQDTAFTIFDDEKIKPYLDAIEGDTRGRNAGSDDRPGPGGDDDDPNTGRPTSEARVNVLMESMEH